MNIPNIGSNIEMHNYFTAVVKDAVTGEVKQRATAYNVVLDQFYTLTYGSYNINFNYIQIGIGTGQPRTTDTALFNRQYTFRGEHRREIISPDTLQVTLVVTSPVGNVGDFTEVGFGDTGVLMSHALFTDAENNPIVIKQTATDLLEITAIAFLNLRITSNHFKQVTSNAAIMNSLFGSYSTASIVPARLGVGLATSIAEASDELSDEFFSMHGIHAALGSASGTNLNGTPLQSNQIVRAGVNDGNYGFFNYLAMGISSGTSNYTTPYPSSYVKFPNSAVFPLYKIEGLSVGVGDGVRNVFNCPIDMFVKDSEVIKVNGVTLIRGVDYTVDHHSNHNGSISSTPGSIAKCKSNIPDLTSNLTRYRMFANTVSYNSLKPYDAFTHNNPLYIELDDTDETIGTTLNYITIGGLRPINVVNNDAMRGVVYKLEYSTDGTNYHLATSFTFDGNISSQVTEHFESITAKYWRLSADISNNYYINYSLTKDTPIVQVTGGSTVLGYKGTGITFTSPPESGAVIEMDVYIDRPYKSSSFVVELSGSLSVSR